MTPYNIITLALKLAGALGVGQTPLAQDIDDAFSLLNMMIGQWSQKRWLVYHELDVVCRSNGLQAYSVCSGGNFDTPRPDRIESAFVRLNASGSADAYFQLDVSRLDIDALDSRPGSGSGNGLDYPLEVIEAREDYNLLPFKQRHGIPTSVFYDAAFPVGYLYINPIPSTAYELHITVKQALSSFANLTDDIALPAQYQEALLYNLAGRLAPMYQIPPNPVTVQLASAALNTIRGSNAQVAKLKMPVGLPGMGRRGYGAAALLGGVSTGVAAPALIDPIWVVDSTGAGSGIPNVPGDGSGGGSGGSGDAGTSSVLGTGVLGQMVLGS